MYKSTVFSAYCLHLQSCLCGYFRLQPNCNTSSNVQVLKQHLHSYSREPLTTLENWRLFAKSAEIGADAGKHLFLWRIPGVEAAFNVIVVVTHPHLVVVVRFQAAVSACWRKLTGIAVIGVIVRCILYSFGVWQRRQRELRRRGRVSGQ